MTTEKKARLQGGKMTTLRTTLDAIRAKLNDMDVTSFEEAHEMYCTDIPKLLAALEKAIEQRDAMLLSLTLDKLPNGYIGTQVIANAELAALLTANTEEPNER